MRQELLTTNRKALTINLDNEKYGTIAEIGAGQETARAFFQAGGSAGTIAKTMSAYDMTFSDEIYGKTDRYVSEDRLNKMLDTEFRLLRQRLSEKIGDQKCFFAFANTIKAKSYGKANDAHGWLGIRFQLQPQGEPNDIITHIRLWDDENVLQQQALGIIGINLIYAAYYLNNDSEAMIKSLLDNLTSQRMEVDLIRVDGPDFENVDNRVMSLKLVRNGLTNAVLFSPDGRVMQPSNAFYKKAILVERGSFRPVTRVNIDMLKCAGGQFIQEPLVQGKDIIVLAEITINNLLTSGQGELDNDDFLARIDTLGATGNYTLISNYFEFYRLTSYFRRYTKEMIGVAMGVNNLLEIFNPKYYGDLAGGILENFGRLFRNSVKLYIYPMRQKAYRHYLELMSKEAIETVKAKLPSTAGGIADELLITCDNLRIQNEMTHLYRHLLENDYIEHIRGVDESLLDIFSRDILQLISEGDANWEKMVPEKAAAFIKEKQFFGYENKAAETAAS